jgi:hypothetical protein
LHHSIQRRVFNEGSRDLAATLRQPQDHVAVALARAASRIEPITSAGIKRFVIAALVVGTADSCVALRRCRRDSYEGRWRNRDRDYGPLWDAKPDGRGNLVNFWLIPTVPPR